MISNEVTSSLVPCGFLFSLNCLDNFPVDPAVAPNNATQYQLVTLCRSICTEEKALILDRLMGSEYFPSHFILPKFSPLHVVVSVDRITCCSSTFGTGCCIFWSTCC